MRDICSHGFVTYMLCMHTAIDIYYADKYFGSNQSFLKDLPPELAI